MTLAQKLALQRFDASASVRGVSVKLMPTGPCYTALVEPVMPGGKEFPLAKETRNFSRVHIRRDLFEASGANVDIGSVFSNQDTGDKYRVTGTDDNGVRVVIIFDCETFQ